VDTLYTARFELPDLLEQGKSNVVRCPMHRAGALVLPTVGLCSVWNAANQLVESPAVTFPGNIATATVTSGALSSQALGEGWRIEWTLTMPDAVVHKPRNDAALVRARLFPVITEEDLYRRCRTLDASVASAISAATEWADKIDEAFIDLQQRLISMGNRPNLVLTPSALREVHLLLTLALVFEELASRTNAAYEARAQSYRDQFEAAWARLRFVYDTDDAGAASTSSRRSAGRAVWLNGRGT
jgi:hypothetical protein